MANLERRVMLLISSKTLAGVIATICINVGVFLRNLIGFKLSSIMVVVGIFSMAYYLVEKGISHQAPKYIAAQRNLSLGLWIMAAGTMIWIITIIQSMLSNSGLINTELLAIGTGILIVGCAELLISLRFVPR